MQLVRVSIEKKFLLNKTHVIKLLLETSGWKAGKLKILRKIPNFPTDDKFKTFPGVILTFFTKKALFSKSKS